MLRKSLSTCWKVKAKKKENEILRLIYLSQGDDICFCLLYKLEQALDLTFMQSSPENK